MEIQINRDVERIEVKKVTIFHKNTEFEIYINNFDEIIIMKEQYGEGESNIIIRPSVANVIRIS
jgi:hypothetical protein